MSPNPRLDAARLRELMRYEDGALYWREPGPKHTRGAVGTPAGEKGRLQVHVDGRAYYVHRLVWLYHHGSWPHAQVDHINGDKHDHRIENLRVLTNAGNCRNVDRGGVSFERGKSSRPWRARITVNGRTISLGYFHTRSAARSEYLRAKAVYHPEWVTGAGAA